MIKHYKEMTIQQIKEKIQKMVFLPREHKNDWLRSLTNLPNSQVHYFLKKLEELDKLYQIHLEKTYQKFLKIDFSSKKKANSRKNVI